ncbi:MAG: hypothetical protein JWP40_3271, partial [Blastococcus sp.]|nr:hypothetical protein [Blastococcus sp.]
MLSEAAGALPWFSDRGARGGRVTPVPVVRRASLVRSSARRHRSPDSPSRPVVESGRSSGVCPPAPSAIPSTTSRNASTEDTVGDQPSSVRIFVVSEQGQLQCQVEQRGLGRDEVQLPRGTEPGAHHGAGHRDHPRPEHLTDRRGVDDGVGGDVVGAPPVADDSQPVGLGDVVGVQRLEPQPRWPGDDRKPARADQSAGQQRPGEDPSLLRGGLPLKDERRPQPDDPGAGMPGLERVEHPLDVRLLPPGRRRRDAVGGPGLVHPPARSRGVGADGRGVVEGTDARRRRGLEHPRTAHGVGLPGHRRPVRRLEQPGEMDDGVGSPQMRDEVVAGDVRCHERRLRRLPPRTPP